MKIKNLFKQKTYMESQEKKVEETERTDNIESATTEQSENVEKEKQSEGKDKEQELGEKLVEINDKYLRIYSEYENYRKRTAKEKADLIKYGSEEMIKAILPVVDDFERAIQAFDNSEDTAAFKEGVLLIYNKLIKTLEQKGVKAIEAKGEKFDENLHEAVTQFPAAEESQKGTVIEEVLKGYYLHDKVIRYSKVVVAI
jgi:molecular chaperone GrpE